MTNLWEPLDTTTHQDHVIAHLVGATVLGYFVLDETLYILLDMDFIWTIYLDAEMVLLPCSVAIGELEVGEDSRKRIQAECDNLTEGEHGAALEYFIPVPVDCTIREVNLFAADDLRRLIVTGEEASVVVQTSLATRDIQVYEFK